MLNVFYRTLAYTLWIYGTGIYRKEKFPANTALIFLFSLCFYTQFFKLVYLL